MYKIYYSFKAFDSKDGSLIAYRFDSPAARQTYLDKNSHFYTDVSLYEVKVSSQTHHWLESLSADYLI